MPDLIITDGAVSPTSIRNLDLIVWASERIGLPLGMTGATPNRAVARDALKAKNITVAEESDMVVPGAGVKLRWLAPLEGSNLLQ
ncbi:MAG: hypothetical protein HQ482_06085 [Sphingomonadales bacterium]|nr:hypothetical protein [Sphingomonadales bacterium]